VLQHILDSIPLLKPETALAVTFCVVLVASFVGRGSARVTSTLSLLGLLVTGLFVVGQTTGGSNSIFSNMFAVDPFSIFFKYLILVSSVLIVLFSLQSKELNTGTRKMGEYYALLVALTLGMFLMTGASNLLMMYLALEVTSVSSYILAGYMKEARDSAEASLKYVIYGAVSSGMMLYGISILYGLTGTVDIYGINRVLTTGDVSVVPMIIIGTILMVAGFGYKISAVPFHFWTPDVYEGAPITITAFLSVASKAAGFAMMIRFFKVSFIDPTIQTASLSTWASFVGLDWNYILAAIAVLTMTLGNLVAIWQNNLKRLLAYSSIAHAGYMLLGVIVLSNEGIAAVLVYFVAYLLMNLGAFYAVMLVANKTGSEEIEDYKGLGYRSPILGVTMTIFLLSLTGIPPTAGFIGKLYLFSALINAKWFWMVIIGALNTVVSLYYYVRILRNMFLQGEERSREPIRFSVPQVAMLCAFAIPIILLGVYFTPLVEYAQASVTMFGIR
jgi:NADH-quinone oxidoreductase subunit N